MIGKVTFAEPPAELVLDDDLSWSCPELPEWAEAAAALWRPERLSPAHGQPGHLWLHEAADWLDGTATIVDKPPAAIHPDPILARIAGRLGVVIPPESYQLVY